MSRVLVILLVAHSMGCKEDVVSSIEREHSKAPPPPEAALAPPPPPSPAKRMVEGVRTLRFGMTPDEAQAALPTCVPDGYPPMILSDFRAPRMPDELKFKVVGTSATCELREVGDTLGLVFCARDVGPRRWEESRRVHVYSPARLELCEIRVSGPLYDQTRSALLEKYGKPVEKPFPYRWPEGWVVWEDTSSRIWLSKRDNVIADVRYFDLKRLRDADAEVSKPTDAALKAQEELKKGL